MKYTVASNGDLDLITEFGKYPDVESIFVKMTEDIAGGGRSAFLLPEIDLVAMEAIIDTAHRQGIKVNYVLNSACQSNREYTADYNERLFEFIDSLATAGIDGVVISSPFMLGLIKENWPDLWITVSLFAFADDVEKARYWDEEGAERIILPMTISRNFEMLRKIRGAVTCELELIANLGCLSTCPIDRFHSMFVSHNSSIEDKESRFFIDYHIANCAFKKMRNPAELIKSRWIRPEDVYRYEEIGIDTLKITDRLKNSEWMRNTVRAYNQRRYDGNLMDLIHVSLFHGTINTSLAENLRRGDYFDTHGINPELLKLYKDRKDVEVHIDNSKLNKFLDYFFKYDCSNANCGVDCKYCYKMADKVMTYDSDELDHNVKVLSQVIQMINNRTMFEPTTQVAVEQ